MRAAADGWEARRSDARRNHERVLAAAVEVFAEHGLDATMPQIAARAGVGKATVYRSYPTKADMVRAVVRAYVHWLAERIDEAAQEAAFDAAAALRGALEEVYLRIVQDRLLVGVLAGVDGLEEDVTLMERLRRILRFGVEQGTFREDVTLLDLRIVTTGVAHALLQMKVSDPERCRRYARLSVAALRR